MFKQIIDEASNIGVNSIFLFLHGEPMIHPKIIDMLRHIKKSELSFHMSTNGINLDEKVIRGILDARVDNGDHVSFSIQGASQEIHNKIVGRRCYEKVRNSIHLFLRLRKALNVNGPIIETVYYIMPENQHETHKYLQMWRGVVDHVRLSGEISQSFARFEEAPKAPIVRTAPCTNLWQKMTIKWNGEVVLCCNDVDSKIVLGNMNDQSIGEIWNSQKLLAIKRVHKKREFERIPMCYTCDM